MLLAVREGARNTAPGKSDHDGLTPMAFNLTRKEPSRELVPVDDVIAALPFIVRRDHRIVAAFARKAAAIDWAELRSFNDESRFTVHTAAEVLFVFQDGEEVR
jgi:hypothetical protein